MASGSWWSPRSSKPVRPSSSAWRVRFPSASASSRHDAAKEGSDQVDPRRLIPRTDQSAGVAGRPGRPGARLGEHVVRALVRDIQEQARRGDLPPAQVAGHCSHPWPHARPRRLRPCSTQPASSCIPTSAAPRCPQPRSRPLVAASGYVDVELDLGNRTRSERAPAPGQRCSPPVPPPRMRWSSTTVPQRWCWPPPRWPPAGRWW